MEVPNKKESSNKKNARIKKSELLRNSSMNELNELSSKSLLANVLDINDDFGVISAGKLLKDSSKTNSLPKSSSIANTNTNNNNSTSNINSIYSPYNYSIVNNASGYPHQIGFKREIVTFNANSIDEAATNATTDAANASIQIKNSLELTTLKKSLNSILRELRVITNKLKEDEEEEEKSLNWKFAAMVIDRLCMVFFAFATFFSFVLILLTSKNFFKLS